LAEREKQRASERAAKHRKEGKEGAGKHERDYDEGETCGFLEFWAKNSDTALQQEIAHNVKDILEDPVELYSMVCECGDACTLLSFILSFRTLSS